MNPRSSLSRKKQKSLSGFTLVEILVATAIIGIIATIVLVALGTARQKAKIARAKSDTRNIYNAFVLLVEDTGEWPGHKTPDVAECSSTLINEICADGCPYSLSDCEAGLVCNDGNYEDWNGLYVGSSQLIDPWNNEYFFDTDYYDQTGECIAVIGSYGPNGRGNNEYDEDDIIFILPVK